MSFLYINPGYGNLFDTTNQDTYTQDTNVQNITGLSFHSCGTRGLNIPNLDEIWVRCDVFAKSGSYGGASSICVGNVNKIAEIAQHSYNSEVRVYLHGVEKGIFAASNTWCHYLMHIKSGLTDGVFEVWKDEIALCSFTGNVLDGQPITTCSAKSETSYKPISQIIISDSPIKWTENAIILPTSISATMTDNGDGTYSATEAGQYVKQTIDGDALRNSYPDNTVITGICVAGRPAYHDGEGIDVMQAIEGDTVFGECGLDTNEHTSITYGKRVNMPISSVGDTYGWKAK